MGLDFTPLGLAIRQLEKSLSYANSPAALNVPGLREQMRTVLDRRGAQDS